MGLFEAFIVVWRLVRGGIRWFGAFTMIGLIIYVGMPLSAAQDNTLVVAQTAASQAVIAWNFAADLLNVYYRCTLPVRVLRNRAVSFIYGTLQLFAEEIAGIEIDVGPNLREEPRVLPDPGNLCDLIDTLSTFFIDFLELVAVPLNAILRTLLILLHDGVQAAALNFIDEIEDLLDSELLDALDIGGCFRRLPWSLFYCFCPDIINGGRRFSSPETVPNDPVRAVIACISPTFNFVTGAISDALDYLLGAIQADIAYGIFKNEYDRAVIFYNRASTGLTTFGKELLNYILRVDEIEREFNDKLKPGFESWFKRYWTRIIRFFSRSARTPQARQTARKHANDLMLMYARQKAAIDAHAEIVDRPESGMRSSLPRPYPRFIDPPPANRSCLFASTGPKDFKDHATAKARATIERYVRDSLPNPRAETFMAVGRVLSEAFWSEKPLTAAEVRALHREYGTQPAHFRPAVRQNECRLGFTPRAEYAPRLSLLSFPRPADVTLVGNLLITAGGLCVLVTFVVVLSILFPPTVLAFVFVGIGPVILLAITGASMVAAGSIDDINSVGFIPTVIAGAQYIGKSYFNDGLLSFDVAQFVNYLMPHIWADLWFAASVPVTAFVEALPVDVTMPKIQRGDTVFDVVLGALRCIQNQTCSTISDCRGRPVGCYNGGCMCFGYVIVDREVPRLIVDEDTNIRCSDYGYRYDQMLPYQTGGLSWTNVQQTFASFLAGMRDILQHVATRDLISARALYVYIALVVPIFAFSAALLGKRVLYALYAQEVFYWTLRGLRALGADRISYIAPAFQPPDHGLTCAVYNLPAILLWLIVLGVLLTFITTIYTFVRWLLIRTWPGLRLVGRGARKILCCCLPF